MDKSAFALAVAMLADPVFVASASAECGVANILFGKVEVEIIPHDNEAGKYETAIVRGADFDSKRFPYGKILGELSSRERNGSLPIMNLDHVIVGSISSDLRVEGNDEACDKSRIARLHKVSPTSYVLKVGDSIVGTIDGRLPR
jgi:hypothetical protein